MTNVRNQRLTLDDLIFEGRNKLYGAYVLRRTYPRHLALATAVALSALLLMFLLPRLLEDPAPQTFPPVSTPDDSVIIIFQPLPDLEVRPKSEPPAAPADPAEQVIRRPVIAHTSTYTQDTTSPMGAATDAGTGTGTSGSETGAVGGTETGTGEVPVALPATPVEPTIYNVVEVMPSFPGGDAALAKQIMKNLEYPRFAVESKIQGTVFVSFVIDPLGNVSRVKVEKGIGGGCDEEAVRVIKNLKGWNPARQNGHPVFFKYVLPVRFAIRN